MRTTRSALAALTATLALGLWLHADAQTTSGGKAKPKEKKAAPVTDLKTGLMAATKYEDKTIEKVLKAFGPAFTDLINSGKSVEIPGVGTFQVVRVTEYKDLAGGRPVVVPAKNYIEFVPEQKLNDAANSAGAKPARTVEGYDFRINPNADPGMKSPYTRNPGTRIR